MTKESTEILEEAVRKAKSIIGGQSASPEDVLGLVKTLHKSRKFGVARKLLDRYSTSPQVTGDPKLRIRFAQKRALSTYKDPDLPTEQKLDRALRILREADDLSTTVDQETLGLAGAVYKRMWEYTSREKHLETSLYYYYRGYKQGTKPDFGYTGINAAFVLDLLAFMESPEARFSCPSESMARERRKQARAIREDIAATLPALPEEPGNEWLNGTWWFLVTLGEAYYGLDDYDEAGKWLARATALEEVPDWEYESTARQLAAMLNSKRQAASCNGEELDPRAESVLRKFLDDKYAAIASILRGKVGLALSGGGFRASLYHIGVLARLAELDLLRHVEYLSCVSGGSIIGAHYYLEIRKLLKERKDDQIERADYIRIVKQIAEQFLQGVQRNIRTLIASEWPTNLKMMFRSDYSRTMRAGELYEEELFSRVKDENGGAARWLDDLKFIPEGENPGFEPKDHNWHRHAKVPILILNSTSLNTGHSWQFTASWMGEPPAGIDAEVDANYRLRRMYYEQAPKPHDRVRLGYAVAASACVPGIFEPLSLTHLYERLPAEGDRRIQPVVRLVDGGVHDNQGVASLMEQGCSVLLVSDASGQMDVQDFPSGSILGVPLRSNSILQARVRVSQFQDLDGRRRGGLLKGLMFVHLKKDLESASVDWIGCQDPSSPEPSDPLTGYGVQKGIQRRLSAVRTDLDSFSEAEAYALMTSGYLMTEHALKEPVLGFEVEQTGREDWEFLKIEPLMKQSVVKNPLLRQLKVADKLFFKVWLLHRWLQVAGVGIVLFLLFFLGNLTVKYGSAQLFDLTLGRAVFLALVAAAAYVGLGIASRLLNYRKTVQEILIGLGMTVVGAFLARLHLYVFDRLFLAQGKLKNLLSKGK